MKKDSIKLIEMADSLEELATMICGYSTFALHNDDTDYPIRKDAVLDYLKMGALYYKQKMMKDGMDGFIIRNRYTKTNVLRGLDIACDAIQKFKGGDKVKLIIIKVD